MKRVLLKQIRNEWRENIWIVVALSVVTMAIWIILTVIYAVTQGLFRERGFNPDDVYTMRVKFIKKDSPEYVETGDTTGASYYDDRIALLQRLRKHPDVEAVALSEGAVPYNYNYRGNIIQRFDVTDSVYYMGNFRYGSPDIVKVLKFKSLTGLDENRLAEMLMRGEILISDNEDYESYDRDPMKFKGERVIVGGDSSVMYKVGDVIANVRRNDYELSRGGSVIMPMDENKDWSSDIAVRVKQGRGDSFKESFRKDITLQRQRNVYFTDLRSLMDIREGNQHSIDTQIRMMTVVMGFLLMTVFLELLGTFWFRIHQRVSEIAIRKVCGATRGDIFRRILTEGMILFGFAVVIASACVWPFCHYAGDMLGLEWDVVLIIECIAIVIVALSIVLSVLYPGRKAMEIEPAVAIKDE